MKIACINPVNEPFVRKSTYTMILAHLCEKYKYKPDEESYVIMDNSLIELGKAADMKYIIEAADILKPDEIVLPDVFCKGEENYKKILESIQYLKDHNLLGKYRLMAVCHGKDADEFAHYFHLIKQIPEISCIGIPKVAETLFGKRCYAEYLWRCDCTKSIHLLGCWKSLVECLEYEHPELIRSMDTCIPALLSINKINNLFANRPDKTINLEKDLIDYEYFTTIISRLEELNWI